MSVWFWIALGLYIALVMRGVFILLDSFRVRWYEVVLIFIPFAIWIGILIDMIIIKIKRRK